MDLRARLHSLLSDLLTENPMATASESYVQHYVEFALLGERIEPRYILRIGINYHGQQVQQIQLNRQGHLIGWNPSGDPLGIGRKAKVLLSGHTIVPRNFGEQMMSDTKFGGGRIPAGKHVRIELKVRGWLGQTKNLDGKQLEKDIDLLRDDKADLMVVALSETAHLKWRGGGQLHNIARRTGVARFTPILPDPVLLIGTAIYERDFTFEGQAWSISCQRVIGAAHSAMPGAEHFVTLVWRRT